MSGRLPPLPPFPPPPFPSLYLGSVCFPGCGRARRMGWEGGDSRKPRANSLFSAPLFPLKTPQHGARPGRPEHGPVPGADAGGAAAGDPGAAQAARDSDAGLLPCPSHGTGFPGGVWGVLRRGHVVLVTMVLR